MHFTNILLATFGALIAYAIALVVYRLFFHPFSKYPGPFLAKISYLHAFYHAWIKDTSVEQLRCHRKYGHVVRYGPNTLMFDEPAAKNEIQGATKNFGKGKSYAVLNPTPELPPNIVFQRDSKKHAQRKRIISQAFSSRALRQSQGYAKKHIEALCELISGSPRALDGKWSQAFDFQDLLYWTTQDIMTDMIFGRSYNMLTEPEQRTFGDVVRSALDRNHLAFQYPGLFKAGLNKWLDFGTWFVPNNFGPTMEFLQGGFASTMERIQSPPEDSDERKDILSYLINARDPETGTGIAKEEVIGEASILLLSGASTLSQCLALLYFYLSRPENAHVQARLAKELRTHFADPGEINLEGLENCKYLNAVIAEALRLSSGHAFWREARAGGAVVTIPEHDADDIVPPTHPTGVAKMHVIPQGCVAGFCDFASVRDFRIHPDPESFSPDRWIPASDFYTSRGFDKETADLVYERAKKAVHTFGLGQRACIAELLARSLMRQIVGTLAWQYDIKPADGPAGLIGGGGPGKGPGREKQNEYQWYGSFTFAGEGPMIQLRAK